MKVKHKVRLVAIDPGITSAAAMADVFAQLPIGSYTNQPDQDDQTWCLTCFNEVEINGAL